MALAEADGAMPIEDMGGGQELLSGEEEGEGLDKVSHSGEEGEGFEEVSDSGEEEGEREVTDPEWTCSRAAYSVDLEGEKRGGGRRRRGGEGGGGEGEGGKGEGKGEREGEGTGEKWTGREKRDWQSSNVTDGGATLCRQRERLAYH